MIEYCLSLLIAPIKITFESFKINFRVLSSIGAAQKISFAF